MLVAQSLGEYGAASVLSQLAANAESGAEWLQRSLQEDRTVWIVAAVCLVICMWLFRRR